MKTTFALAALATVVYAQDCSTTTFDGPFQLGSANATLNASKRDLAKRECNAAGQLTVTLKDGILTDSEGRTGEIVSNYQFQYDNPVQSGNLATTGFSTCSNGSLALNGNAVFYECYDNTRTSIYSPTLSPVGGNCYPVYLPVIPCSSSATPGAAVTQLADGQPEVTSACVPITEMSDGQPVVSSCSSTSTCVPVTEMSDGQPVVSACPVTPTPTPTPTTVSVPISATSDEQPILSSKASANITVVATSSTTSVLVQKTDGQIQATGSLKSNPSSTQTTAGLSAGNSLTIGSRFAAAIVGLTVVVTLW